MKMRRITILTLAIGIMAAVFRVCFTHCQEEKSIWFQKGVSVYFYGPDGDDNNPGTLTKPLQHWQHSIRQLDEGDSLIYIPAAQSTGDCRLPKNYKID